MSIAGSDSSGGAGIQADLKAFAACGVYGTTAITAITAQNTVGVDAVEVLSPEIVYAQIKSIATDLPVSAIKTGMLANSEIIRAARVDTGDRAADDGTLLMRRGEIGERIAFQLLDAQ